MIVALIGSLYQVLTSLLEIILNIQLFVVFHYKNTQFITPTQPP